MGGRTVAIQFVRAALDMMRAGGHDPTLLLETAGIPGELVAEDAARVTEAQAARLIRALWDASDDELLGFGPKPMPRGTFRMMTLGLIHAPDLAAVLSRSVEFSRIAFGVDVSILECRSTTRMSLTAHDGSAITPAVAALILAVAHRFGGWLIGGTIELEAVSLTGAAPPAPAEYLDVYGVTPEFGAATPSIVFDSGYLRAPVVQDEQALDELIRHSPNELLFRRQYRRSTAGRVRRILE
ncbi:MAG: AraC family transcriptional regulator ligand-binding domain-containing protein, partial [Actinomycetota bacterium]|nr:AraC family transcriptional regulator ligand-binding domain-containing protein [Actinomycetota bacterium]